MSKRAGAIAGALAAALAVLWVWGCGGGDQPTQGGTATVQMGTAPDYLDPQLGYTTQAAEADWISYTPLLTYRHENAPGGSGLIPGLAESLPQVTGGGKLYTLTLRPGLVYSNGQPVRAGDFPYTIERAIKLDWGGKSFFTDNIEGAAEFAEGRADSISGITADDATGQITIRLMRPYGAFSNVLAFPAAGLVPSGTPIKNLSNDPPPGVGPYMITAVARNRGWTMVKNPRFAALNLPGIPKGDLERIVVTIEPNTRLEAEQVLRNRADNFDAADPLPASIAPRVEDEAGDRFRPEQIPSTAYFFMNGTIPPFNSELARHAVVTALDRPALEEIANGFMKPDCYFIPAGIVGHPTSPCPYGDPSAHGDVKAARLLVQQSGTAGQPVTVWGEDRSPQVDYVAYYVKLLDRLGYQATPKIVPSLNYYETVGAAGTNPQTGFARWFNDFPNPSDFYRALDSASIQSTNSENLAKVNDIFIRQQLLGLNLVSAHDLGAAAGRWRDLDAYTAKKAYVAVIGAEEVPKFMSERIDFDSAVFHPLFFNDWSTWSLNPPQQ